MKNNDKTSFLFEIKEIRENPYDGFYTYTTKGIAKLNILTDEIDDVFIDEVLVSDQPFEVNSPFVPRPPSKNIIKNLINKIRRNNNV